LQHDGDFNGAKHFYLHDRLGSVREVIDTSASVKHCYTYDPWGLTVGDETDDDVTISNPFLHFSPVVGFGRSFCPPPAL